MVSSARSHQIHFWIFAATSHKSNPRSIIYIYIYPISSHFVIMLIYPNVCSSLRACVYRDTAYIIYIYMGLLDNNLLASDSGDRYYIWYPDSQT